MGVKARRPIPKNSVHLSEIKNIISFYSKCFYKAYGKRVYAEKVWNVRSMRDWNFWYRFHNFLAEKGYSYKIYLEGVFELFQAEKCKQAPYPYPCRLITLEYLYKDHLQRISKTYEDSPSVEHFHTTEEDEIRREVSRGVIELERMKINLPEVEEEIILHQYQGMFADFFILSSKEFQEVFIEDPNVIKEFFFTRAEELKKKLQSIKMFPSIKTVINSTRERVENKIRGELNLRKEEYLNNPEKVLTDIGDRLSDTDYVL